MEVLQAKWPWAVFNAQGTHVSCSWCTAAAAAHPEGPPDIGSRKIAAEYKLWWSTPGQPLPDDRDYWDKSCANHVRTTVSVISIITQHAAYLTHHQIHSSSLPIAEAQQHACLCAEARGLWQGQDLSAEVHVNTRHADGVLLYDCCVRHAICKQA